MRGRSRALRFVRPLSLVAIPSLFVVPGLTLGPSLDAAVFVLTGIRVREGALPYRDVWDHKPPGIYLFNAATQSMLPFVDPWLVAWALSLAATIATVLLLDAVLRTRGTWRWSWAASAAAAVLLSAYPVALGGAHTETFALLPIVGALALVALRPRSVAVVAVVGLLLGVACLFSLLAVPAAATIGLAAVFTAPRGEGEAAGDLPGRRSRAAALCVAGASLPLATLAWLAAAGLLPDAYDQLVTYSAAYHASRGSIAPALLAPGWLYLFALPFLVAGLARIAAARRIDPVAAIGVVWLFGFAGFVAIEGRIYLHYTILVVPAVALLGMEGAAWLAEHLAATHRARRVRGLIVAVDAAILLAISVAGLGWLTAYQYGNSAEWRPTAERLAADVRRLVPPGAPIFVWGDNADVYLLADRPPATRYIYQLPTVTPYYWSPARTEQLLEQLRAHPPAAIVETSSGVLFNHALEPADCRCGDIRHYDTLDPLRQFVYSRYRAAADVDGLHVYLPIEAVARP